MVYRRGLTLYRGSIIRKAHPQQQTIANRRLHSHYHSYYTQPLGTLIYYNGNNFSTYNECKFVAGIPLCEKRIKLPSTFSPTVHSNYYNENVEMC